jgi:zinc transport system substrate-binding protein
MMKISHVILIVILILPSSAFADTDKDDKMSVFVSILPLSYFVERIGGDYVDVHVLVGPGQSPETFEPTSKQLVQLAQSQAFVTIGMPFEAEILKRIWNNFDKVEIIKTDTGIKHKETDHHHGIDPHIWLDPTLAIIISGNVYIGLAQLDPDHKNEYESNVTTLIDDITNIDKEITDLLAPLTGKKLYVIHPAYGYFAEAYGLVQVSIEEGGTTPGSKHLTLLIDQAKTEKVRAIFTQPQHSSSSAKTIASEIGANIIVLDPLSRDYLTNLKEMAQSIKKAINEE